MNIDPEFYRLLPTFKKKLLYGKIDHFAFQTLTKWGPDKGFGYDWKKRTLINQDLENHFYKDYIDQGNRLIGGLAFRSVFGANNDIVKKIVIDCDTVDTKEFAYKEIIPRADKLGIEWMIEQGGDPIQHSLFSWDRCHVIFLTEVHKDLSTAFMRQFMAELGEPILARDEKFLDKKVRFDEIKGTGNQLMQAVRFEYAFHLKRMRRYPLEFQGGVLDGPIDVMKGLIQMKPITEDFMKSYIKDDFFPPDEAIVKKVYEGWTPEKLIYNSLGLPIPDENEMPRRLRPLYRECQALNQMLHEAYDDELINKQGQQHHDSGLVIAGSARFHDVYFKQVEGREWFWEKLKPKTRFRDAKSHHWWYGSDEEPGYQYLWNCKTIDEYFGKCGGCKYQCSVTNPREFMFNTPISRTPQSTDKKLVTLDYIRNKTFPDFKKMIKSKHLMQERSNYLLASVIGSGKSTCIKELVVEMIGDFNSNVLISVPTAKLALEYRDWFKNKGIDAFAHLSHENTFGHQAGKETSLACFDCPFFKEIQEQHKAGVQSSSYKEEFCYNGCPYLDQCYYPDQFKQVMEDDYKVVLIQHAHMSCTEVIHNLLKKGFDLLVIDETFIENTYDYIEIDSQEIEYLESHGEDWTVKLADWLSGRSKAKGKLNPDKDAYARIADTFRAFEKVYRVPDLVRFYNQHRTVNPITGIEIVYELPYAPIRIFTDATPPVDLIKMLTGVRNLEVFGDNEIVDIKSIHPLNERYQILDINNSVTRMKDEEFFVILMTKICELIRNKHKDDLCLITCYKNDKERVRQFIQENYPDIEPRVDLGLISKGTNRWESYTVQFIIAGRYRVGADYLKDLYKYCAVANYYRAKAGASPIPNIYLNDVKETSITRKGLPVQILQKQKNSLRVFKYNDMRYFVSGEDSEAKSSSNPYFWFKQMDLLDISDMMQAERIRPNTSKPVTFYHLHNRFMDKVVITKPLTFSEFLSL